MASLGQDLKQEREKRGISLEEISRSTRISYRFLQAIENDNYDLLPGGFFNKAFLRAYLQYLGLEEKPYLDRYETIYRQKITAPKKEAQKNQTIKTFPWVRIFFTFLILAVGLGFLYLLFQLRPKSEPVITRAIMVEPTKLPVQIVEEKKETKPEPITEINMKIDFHQKTWIQIYADGVLRLDGLKNPGDTFEVTASKEILLHLGNAGGLTYTLNGFKGRSFGRPGVVVKNIRITLDNFKEFIEPESPPESSNQKPSSAIH